MHDIHKMAASQMSEYNSHASCDMLIATKTRVTNGNRLTCLGVNIIHWKGNPIYACINTFIARMQDALRKWGGTGTHEVRPIIHFSQCAVGM